MCIRCLLRWLANLTTKSKTTLRTSRLHYSATVSHLEANSVLKHQQRIGSITVQILFTICKQDGS